MLLEPEYRDIYGAYATAKNPASTRALVDRLKPSIDRSLRTHVGEATPLLQGRAKRLVVDALPKYDPKKSRLSTFVYSQLEGMKRIAAKQQNAVRTPERLRMLRSSIQREQSNLLDELGYEPSDAELAERMRISVDKLRKARAASTGTPESGLLADVAMRTTANPEASRLWLDLVYEDLQPRQKIIVDDWRRGEDARVTAAKLRVTPAAVSQQRAKIQAILDQEEALSPYLG